MSRTPEFRISGQKTKIMATLGFKSLGKDAVQKFIDVKCIKEGQSKRQLIDEELWENEDFDVCVFDEDKMMTHMLDCYAALCSFQQYRDGREQSNQLDAKTQQAKNKAFKIALSLMSRGMTHDDAGLPDDTSVLSRFVSFFPDDSKHTDGRGWMPLHWAALSLGTPEGDLHGLTEKDFKLLYATDPTALQRFHDSYIYRMADPLSVERYTPLHFICIQPVTPSTMSLLRYFSICNLQALISSTYTTLSVLHATCRYGQPTEELLQHLLQLDSSQVTKECGEGYTPLQYLCKNKCCSERLMNCLLQFDSSAAVVGGVISACITSKDPSSMLEKVDTLLKVNPEAAQYHFGPSQRNLLHVLAGEEMSSALCIDIMKRILALYPDAVKEVDDDGELPVHNSAEYGSLDVMEFLLGLNPESATIVTVGESENLLHLAVSLMSSVTFCETKVRYLCSRYPEFIHQRNKDGETPLHIAVHFCFITSCELLSAKILCEVAGNELIRVPVVHPSATTTLSTNGWLPLHFFMSSGVLKFSSCSSPLSEKSDFFRMLLRWYPEAAGIEAGTGKHKKTPYKMAVDRKVDPYYLRLLLHAAPNLNLAELHRLNYAERRMAMFMAFRAITTQPTPLLLARLRFENKDLVKHVVSFL